MVKPKLIIITPTSYSRHKNRDGKVACYFCDQKFSVCDKVISKQYGGPSRHQELICKKCAEEKGISYDVDIRPGMKKYA